MRDARKVIFFAAMLALSLTWTGCSGGGGGNSAPRINSLTANPDTVQTGAESQTTCTATDQDGDALTYQWSCGAGEIAGNDANATFTAPATPQVCTITCSVSDGKDKATATAQVNVTVEAPANAAPLIDSLVAAPNAVATRGRSEITCTAHDADGDTLTYQWIASDGQFDGPMDGPTVTWDAPAVEGTCTITCTIDDGKTKATASQSVDIEVSDANAELLGEWWLMSAGTSPDDEQPFGPDDPCMDPFGHLYEYHGYIFNADGTYTGFYRYCHEASEQRWSGTWTYNADEGRWWLDADPQTSVEIEGAQLLYMNESYEVFHRYGRAENGYVCPDASDPTGTWALDDLEFNFRGIAAYHLMYVLLFIDEEKATGSIALSGDDEDGYLYSWYGTYTRDGDVLTAIGLELTTEGDSNMLDLQLEVDGDTITGTARNYNQEATWESFDDVSGHRITYTTTGLGIVQQAASR